MNTLSVNEIGGMLEKQGLAQYAPDFRRKKVDGAALCKMELTDLIKLGVMNTGHQAALLQRIELYRDDPKASASKGSPWITPVFGLLQSAKAKVLEAASQCMASTQKGVAGCTDSVGKHAGGVGSGGGGSDSGVKAKVLEAVSHCMESTQEGFTACTESVSDATQALREKCTGESAGGGGGGGPGGLAMPRGRRTVVMAPSVTIPKGWKPPVYKKSATAEGFLMQALATNKLFKTLAPSDCEMLMKAFQEVRFKQGQQIIKQGEPGDKFYLLDSGTCDIAVQGKGTVMKAKRGVAFGELALLHNAPRAATVTAESDVCAWQVDATTFKSILMSKSKADAQDYASFIKEVPLLKSLSKEDVRSLLDALEEQAFGANQQIVREGETGDAFYIVREGEVRCTAKKSKVEVSRRLKRSDFFGEHGLELAAPSAPSAPDPHPPHPPDPQHSLRRLRAASAPSTPSAPPPHRLCTLCIASAPPSPRLPLQASCRSSPRTSAPPPSPPSCRPPCCGSSASLSSASSGRSSCQRR